MATHQEQIDRLSASLRKADAAGNAEEAQLIARELRRIQALPQGDAGVVDAAERFAAGTSRGVSQMLGAPVDLTNAMMSLAGAGVEEPVGGSRSFQRMFASLGLGPDPDEDLGRAGTVGEVVGASSVGAGGMVAAGSRVAANAVDKVQRIPGILAGLAEDVFRTAIRNPVTFTAAEGAAATGAGMARYEALQRWPDDPGAQALAELVGGFSPLIAAKTTGLLVEKLPMTGSAIRFVRNAYNHNKPRSAEVRARDRIDRALPDKSDATSRLNRTDIIEDSGLTPAQRVADKELLALERSIMEQDAVLDFARQEQLTGVNQKIQESMLAIPEGDVPTGQIKAYFRTLLDERIRQAAVAVDETIAKMGPHATREDLNRLARQELDNARLAARAQEQQLYDDIPGDARVPTTATQEVFENFRMGPAAQQEDIPAQASQFLRRTVPGPKGPQPNKKFLGDETTVEEMRALYSKFREEARIARGNQQFNKARIADDLADGISDDIANAVGNPEVKEAVDIATQFSKDFNDRFTRGPAARILGSDRAGGARTDPSLTLETTVGKRGPRAKVETDALLEAVQRHGDTDAMRDHIQGFLIDDFRRAAVDGGQISPQHAQRWIADNQDVLQTFPELRVQLERAATSGQNLIDAQRLIDPNVSRTAVFINASPGDEINRVLSTADPRGAMRDLLVLARRDPTGRAEKGLKDAFYAFLLSGSRVSATDVNEVPFVSGRRMGELMRTDTVSEGMRGLFTRAELNRLDKIRETAMLLDAARLTPASIEGVIGDKPGMLFQMLARVGGAQIGRVLAAKTGGGTVQTPGILSTQAQKLLNSGIQDPARRLLTDAIQDETLFRALLLPQTSQRNVQLTKARLNAWVADVLREQYAMPEENE